MKFTLIALLALFSPIASAYPGDTGTYEILEYRVKLNPLENGDTRIDYYQKWKVTGGTIPWITVGTANASYSIMEQSAKGAISSIRSANQGRWSGVRIDLDRTYKPSETFEVEFALLQKNLLYRSKDETCYSLRFIPGWYDRAVTRALEVELECFADLKDVKTSPQAVRVGDRDLRWTKTSLGRGERFTIMVSIPKALYPGTPHLAKPAAARTGSDIKKPILLILFCALIPVIIVLVILAVHQQKHAGRYGGGGRLGAGSSGIHGRGGCVVACACACVACACACACAGGGAAGCDRKITSTCPLCRDCEKEDCPLHPGLNHSFGERS